MEWLRYGGDGVYIPAHARPSILAGLMRLGGFGILALNRAARRPSPLPSQVSPVLSADRAAQLASVTTPARGTTRTASGTSSPMPGRFISRAAGHEEPLSDS
jgi:hypothetical protein